MGATDLVYLQSAKEASWGTDKVATARWMGADKFGFKAMPVYAMRRYQRGDLAPAHSAVKTHEEAAGSIEGDVTFEDIIMLYSSAVKGAVAGSVTDTSAYTWSYPAPLLASPALESRLFEVYDGSQGYQALGMVCESFSLSGDAGSDSMVRFSSKWIGKAVEAAVPTNGPTSRVVEAIPANIMKLYVENIGGTVGSTVKADTLISWNVNYKTGAHLKQFQSGALTPSSFGFAKPSLDYSITAEFSAAGIAEITAFLAGTGRLIRLEGLGSLAGATTAKRTFTIDIASQHLAMGNDIYGDRDGNTTLTLTGSARYDSGAFANYAKFTVINAASTMIDA